MKEIETKDNQPTPTPHPGEWDQFTRQAAVVILMLGVLFLLAVLRPLLNLLGITGIVILILSYPINGLRAKTKLAYPIVVLIVFIPLAVLLFIIFGNVASWFVDNAKSLVTTLQSEIELNQATISSVEQFLNAGGSFSLTKFLDTLANIIVNQLGLAITFISFAFISVFLAFLFILEMPANIAKSFQSLSDVSQREFGILIDRLSYVWTGWLRSTVITSLIIGTTTAIELFLFGIPYAGILGVITGFLNMIPTFGALVSYLLIIIVTYTQGSTKLDLSPVTLTVLVWGVNVLINQVTRLVIFPRLAGKAVHLPVFFVILGLIVAAVLWGVLGVILVIPLLGTVREVISYVLKKINKQDPFPGEQPQAGFWTQEISAQETVK
jgi:predicted PurR-regulated permease PerM